MIERTEQLSSFMRRFADVFRLPPPLARPCDLVAVLEDIVRLLGAGAGCRRDSLAVGARSAVGPRATIDRGQMEQALLNILKNAIEAIDGDGHDHACG